MEHVSKEMAGVMVIVMVVKTVLVGMIVVKSFGDV